MINCIRWDVVLYAHPTRDALIKRWHCLKLAVSFFFYAMNGFIDIFNKYFILHFTIYI